jgi:hypothetical protein
MLAGLIPRFHKCGEASPISARYISTRAGTVIKREALSPRDKAGEGPDDGCSSATGPCYRAFSAPRKHLAARQREVGAGVLERVNSPVEVLASHEEQIRGGTPLESRLLKIGDRKRASRVARALEVEKAPSLTDNIAWLGTYMHPS